MGEDWGRLTAAYVATRTFQERVFGDTSGTGSTGIDDSYAAAYFEGVGAEIMGAAMFGLHSFPDDPDWKGWWGDQPPFGTGLRPDPHSSASVDPDAGRYDVPLPQRTLPSRTCSPRRPRLPTVADVRIGGGLGTAREFLRAGLVDHLHVAIAPILLGRGNRLWDDLRGLELTHQVTTEVAESGTCASTPTPPPPPASRWPPPPSSAATSARTTSSSRSSTPASATPTSTPSTATGARSPSRRARPRDRRHRHRGRRAVTRTRSATASASAAWSTPAASAPTAATATSSTASRAWSAPTPAPTATAPPPRAATPPTSSSTPTTSCGPDGIDPAAAAPLLCAGITTYSPLRRWGAGPGKKVAVVGLGGLGHMAVKLAHALGAEVTVLSQSLKKQEDGLRLGADHYYATSDPDTFEQLAGRFDLIVNTVSASDRRRRLPRLLAVDGTLVNVGAPAEPLSLNVFSLIGARRSFAGSMIGGIALTQEMLDFCAEHHIGAEVEVIPPTRSTRPTSGSWPPTSATASSSTPAGARRPERGGRAWPGRHVARAGER
jgi:predicted flap endonuclease-1-like 5' DNA nuclease